MGEFKSFKQRSRDTDWGTDEKATTIEHVNTGARMRMADALETIAKDKQDLLDQIERLKTDNTNIRKWWVECRKERHTAQKQAAAYKGLYNKLKNNAR